MEWKDNLITDSTLFKDLEIGKGFEKDKILYIKMGNNCVFDVIHKTIKVFHDDVLVLPRDCEIVFY